MTKRAEKRQEARSFTFRMPGDLFDDLSAVARARGVDVSAMLNWILAEYRPTLLKKKAEHEAAMVEACAARPWTKMSSTDQALTFLRELLRDLQDEYAKLSKRALDEDEQRAA
jgi:hypothetical protein